MLKTNATNSDSNDKSNIGERTESELLACYYGECPVCACPMIFQPTCCNGKGL